MDQPPVWSCVRVALRRSSGPLYSYEPTCSESKSQAVVREPGQLQQPPYRMVLSATAVRRLLTGILRYLPPVGLSSNLSASPLRK